MIEAIVVIVSILLFLIMAVKFYNIVNNAKIYDVKISLIGFCLGVILYGVLFFLFLGSISYAQTSTIVDGSETVVITQESNMFQVIQPFVDLSNGFFSLIFIFTIAEGILTVIPTSRDRMKSKKE